MEGAPASSARQRKPASKGEKTNTAQFNNALLAARYQEALQRRLKPKTPKTVKFVRYFAVFICLFGLLSRYHSFLRKSEEDLLATPGKLIKLDNNTYFHLHCHNPTDGSDYSKNPTVILVHGVAGSSLEWQLVTKEISRHVRVCTIDRAIFTLFPFNLSRNCTQLSNEMDAILRTAEIDPPYVLVGHSYGGFIVQHYAYTHPEKVAGLVLVDSAHEDQEERIFNQMYINPKLLAKIFISISKYLSGFGFIRLLGYFHAVHFPPTYMYPSEHLANILYSDPVVWIRANDELAYLGESADIIKDMRRTHQFEPDLPIVVITALDKNKFVADTYTELHKKILGLSTNTHHVLAPHSDHCVQLQSPELVTNAILEVLEKTGYTIE